MKTPLLVLALALTSLGVQAGTLVEDNFSSPVLAGRDLSPARGGWQMADGVASCTQDDALYAKNKNHGPILWYNAPLTDGTVRFSVRSDKVRQFIITLNDEKGHLFRAVIGQNPLSVHAWNEQGPDAKPDNLPVKDAPKLTDGAWTPVELKFAGDQCTISVGDGFKQTFTHPTIAKQKTKLGLGFAFGTLAIRNVSVTAP
jgi:hypothetical protein